MRRHAPTPPAARPPSSRVAAIRLVVTLLLCAQTQAAELPTELRRAIAAAPQAEDLPDAAAVYLRHERIFAIDERGHTRVTLHQTVKILQVAGRRYGVIYLPWVTPYQTVEVELARTILPDLSVVDVTGVALEQTLPGRFGERLGSLSRYRLNLPYAEPGAVVDYRVTIADTRPSRPDGFADQFQMQLDDPVLLARYVIAAPPNLLFDRHLNGDLPPPTVVRRAERNETTWEARDLPGLADEPDRPATERLALRVLVSSFTRWDDVAEQYRRLALPHYVAHGPLRERVAALTADAEPVPALYEWVATQVRYAFGALERGMPGVEPRSAYETFQDRLGDCKDQATLLLTMLDEAGVQAWPALLRRNPGGPVVESLPAMIQFDHVVVAVPTGGGFRWLDPTWSYGPLDYLPYDIQGVRAMVVRPDRVQWAELPVYGPETNQLRRTGEIAVGPDGGLSASVVVDASGGFEQSLRSRFQPLTDAVARGEVLAGLDEVLPTVALAADGFAVSEPRDLDQPFELRYAFTSPDAALRTKRLILLQPALLERAEVPAAARGERRYPLRLAAAPERTINELTFTLPPELAVREVPESRGRRERFAEFAVEVRLDGRTLRYRRELTVREAEVPAADTATVRAFYQDLLEADRQLLVLERRDGS